MTQGVRTMIMMWTLLCAVCQHTRHVTILSLAKPRQTVLLLALVQFPVQEHQAGNHLHNELLAQQWACDTSIPDVLEVLKAALEVLAVCQHTQAGCTPFFVCLGNLQQHQLRLQDTYKQAHKQTHVHIAMHRYFDGHMHRHMQQATMAVKSLIYIQYTIKHLTTVKLANG